MPNKDYITIFDALAVKHWTVTLTGILRTNAMAAILPTTNAKFAGMQGDRYPDAKKRDISVLTREIDAPRQFQRSTSSLGRHYTYTQSPNTTSREGGIHSLPRRYSMGPGRK